MALQRITQPRAPATNNLQNPTNKREIKADEKLRAVFGKDSVSMFEMNKHLAQHLK